MGPGPFTTPPARAGGGGGGGLVASSNGSVSLDDLCGAGCGRRVAAPADLDLPVDQHHGDAEEGAGPAPPGGGGGGGGVGPPRLFLPPRRHPTRGPRKGPPPLSASRAVFPTEPMG